MHSNRQRSACPQAWPFNKPLTPSSSYIIPRCSQPPISWSIGSSQIQMFRTSPCRPLSCATQHQPQMVGTPASCYHLRSCQPTWRSIIFPVSLPAHTRGHLVYPFKNKNFVSTSLAFNEPSKHPSLYCTHQSHGSSAAHLQVWSALISLSASNDVM